MCGMGAVIIVVIVFVFVVLCLYCNHSFRPCGRVKLLNLWTHSHVLRITVAGFSRHLDIHFSILFILLHLQCGMYRLHYKMNGNCRCSLLFQNIHTYILYSCNAECWDICVLSHSKHVKWCSQYTLHIHISNAIDQNTKYRNILTALQMVLNICSMLSRRRWMCRRYTAHTYTHR